MNHPRGGSFLMPGSVKPILLNGGRFWSMMKVNIIKNEGDVLKIEDLREDVGKSKLYINGMDIESCPYFDDYFSINAFYNTLHEIELFENVTDFIKIKNSSMVIAQWFISLESYISSILKVSCMKKSYDFNKVKSKDLPGRVGALIELLGFDKAEVYKNNIMISQINEFCCFRNELFHDRYNNTERIYDHTKFSKNVYEINQADVIQAMSICIEVYNLFRYSFINLDLMPNIIIMINDTFTYEKIDLLYYRLVLPCWFDILEKHNLQTDIQTEIKSRSLPTTKAFDTTDVSLVMKHSPATAYPFNATDTAICRSRFDELKEEYHVEDGCFQIPNYKR